MSASGMPLVIDGDQITRVLEGTDTLYVSALRRSTSGNLDIGPLSGYDLVLYARGTSINLNDASNTSLIGFTSTTVIGALNELKGSGGLSDFPVDIDRYGFTNRDRTTISFDGTDTFTLTDAGSGWSYYRTGLKYTISGNKTKQLASPMVDGTLYYIFINATDGTLSVDTNAWTLNDTRVPVALVYWNSTLTPKYILADERHTCLIDRRIHRYEHISEGTKYLSGATISGLTAGSDTPSTKTFGLTSTDIADEDIFLTLSALTDPEGLTSAYYNVYRTSTTAWIWASSDMPFKYADLGGGNYGFLEYDNGGTSTPSASNKFVNTYVVVTNVVSNDETNQNISTGALRYFVVQGRGSYNTAAAAYAESFGSFSLVGFPVNEAVALYQLTWSTTTRPATVKGRCQFYSVQRITSNIVTTTVSATASHNTLSGIQGGTTNEYYHLTSTEYTYAASLLSSTATFSVTSFDVDSTAGISLDAATASNFTVSGSTADLTLGARGTTITLNQSGSTSLSGFTATSIIGALNELKSSGGGGTLDSAYDYGGSGSGRSITADAGAVAVSTPNSSNNVVLALTQSDVTNNPAVLTISNAGTGVSISLAGAGSRSIDAGASDLTLGARSATVTLNQNGNTSLVGFTATSIVGALNELKAGSGGGSIIFDDTFATGSVTASSYWEHELSMGLINSGIVQLVFLEKVSGACSSVMIRVYDDDPSSSGVIIYQASDLNLTSADHNDSNTWFCELVTTGSAWVRIYNTGTDTDSYSFRFRILADNGTPYGE